jgi:urea transport system ATP-binding protein
MAIILVEQYFDFAFSLADRFYTLKRGRVTMAAEKPEVERDAVLKNVTV